MNFENILVVEDDTFQYDVLVTLLELLGWKNTSHATDGVSGLQMIESAETPFDLILCDNIMPNMDGMEFFTKVRENSRYEDTPFVMMTAKPVSDTALIAKERGVTVFLQKPFYPERLRERLEAAISFETEDQSGSS